MVPSFPLILLKCLLLTVFSYIFHPPIVCVNMKCYLFYCLNLLEGLLGFGLGRFGSFKGCSKLGRSRLQVELQTHMFFQESLKRSPHLADLRLKFLPLGALRGRLLLGLGQRLLEGRHLSCGPYNKQCTPVIFCNCVFL